MGEQLLVSIVIPVYNAGDYLRAAVESIVQQTYKNLEIIIVDDGSTDGCLLSVRDIITTDKRIRLLQQQNAGKAAALNRALDVMTGEFWGIQDADDLSYPSRIEKQVAVLLAHKELAAVYVGHDLLLGTKRFAPTFRFYDSAECRRRINRFEMPGHDATGLYRRKWVQDIRFDEELRIGQGVDYVLKVGERHFVMLVPECLYTYRINYNSTIRKDPDKNVRFVRMVIEKAHRRRGLNTANLVLKSGREYRTSRRARDNHIVDHTTESVIDLKRSGRVFDAWQVGWICFKLCPFDFYYHKPLVFCLLPVWLIDACRTWKRMMRVSSKTER
jgi:glycosyltransferase involved in cell wall biosynthesis